MFLGSKGHGRSTLLRFLQLSRLNLSASNASSLIKWSTDLGDQTGVCACVHVCLCLCVQVCTTSNGNLDIGVWNCDYLNIQKLQRKGPSLLDEKSISISFQTWDFPGDVSNIVLNIAF